MASAREIFWENGSFAFVGHSEKRKFPVLSFDGVRKQGKTVYAVDPSVEEIAGERTVATLADLPGPVDAAVIEVPKEETADRVRDAAKAGIRKVWLHMGTDTPEALAAAEEAGIEVQKGTCAVMYVDARSYHRIHRFFMKLFKKF